jgi:integrase
MGRPRSPQPQYCQHKKSGHAFVTIDGRQVWLGPHGTQESRDAYPRVLVEWVARGRQPAPPSPADREGGRAPSGYSIAQLIAAFWAHPKDYYRDPDGHSTGELENFRAALHWLRRLYQDTAVANFGPLALKAIRAEAIKPHAVRVRRCEVDPESGDRRLVEKEIVRPGWCRTYANRQIARVRQVFKWGVENELVPPAVYQGLAAVSALKKGKSGARESKPVRAVAQEDVDRVLPLLPPNVRAMVELEAVTGMRPGEVRTMRTGDVDRSNPELWVYTPRRHKTQHHGDDHVRKIYLGARAQEVVTPFLRLDPDAYLFRPEDADEWAREQKRLKRRTKLTSSQLRRAERAAARAAKRRYRDHYMKDAYNRAVRRACDRAGLAAWWTPNRLRHAAATRIRAQYGLEASQVILGHRHAKITEVYAEPNQQLARKIRSEVG